MKLIITVGLPGSGKSSYLARLGVHAISSDEIRRLLIDDATNQTIHTKVFRTIRYLVRERLALGRAETYVDATHLTRKDRRPYIKLGELYGCEAEALFFDVPLEICIERNRGRERIVPEQAIREMALTMRAPTIEEGFARVTSIRL